METSSKETETNGKLICFHEFQMVGEYDKSADLIECTFTHNLKYFHVNSISFIRILVLPLMS